MKNLKKISALILIVLFSSCNEESLIEGRLPVEVAHNGQQGDNVSFTVDGISYSGGALALENQSNSFCTNFLVAASYNSLGTKGINIFYYQQTSTTIFDSSSNLSSCNLMKVGVQIDAAFYLSTAGTYTVSGNIFTLNCTAIEQAQVGQVGATIHYITATGKII